MSAGAAGFVAVILNKGASGEDGIKDDQEYTATAREPMGLPLQSAQT